MPSDLGLHSPPEALLAEIERLRAQFRLQPYTPPPEQAALAGEAKLHFEQAMLEAIFKHAPIGLSLAAAPDGRSLMINDALKEITGRDHSGADFNRLVGIGAAHPDGRPYAPEEYPIARSILTGEVVQRELTMLTRPGGQRRRVEVSSTPVHAHDTAPAAAIAVVVDVEEREQARERQQLLIGELAHRMKNTLAMVQAIVSQTLRASITLEGARELIMQRFSVLARAQDILTQTNWDSAAMDLVVAGALAPLAHGPDRIRVEGPEVRLGARAALNFTLALHELGTNAMKYGALSTPEGWVEIDWRLESAEAGPRLAFSWREVGGPPVSPPQRRGFGSRLLESLSRTFDAQSRLIHAPDGVLWRVEVDCAVLQQL